MNELAKRFILPRRAAFGQPASQIAFEVKLGGRFLFQPISILILIIRRLEGSRLVLGSSAVRFGLFLWLLTAMIPGGLSAQNGPIIQGQPQNQNVLAGGTAMFNVSAVGTGSLNYQWFRSTGLIANATSSRPIGTRLRA